MTLKLNGYCTQLVGAFVPDGDMVAVPTLPGDSDMPGILGLECGHIALRWWGTKAYLYPLQSIRCVMCRDDAFAPWVRVVRVLYRGGGDGI